MRSQFISVISVLAELTFLAAATQSHAADRGPALAPVAIEQVKIDDPFWSPKRDVWRRVTIVDCFDKFERDGAIANFDKVRDGRGGTHAGPQWYDGLVYEMITGAADFLRERPDERLQQRIDGYIARIAAAADKDPDGYLNTHTQLVEPNHRWGMNGGNDREQHDLYNAGCLVEAGIHYYRATGKTELLRVATRVANHMCEVMGPPPRKNVIPGHALPEATIVELCRLFREQPELKQKLPFKIDEACFLDLARFWVENRGNHEGRRDFGPYNQDHKPVLQQETIEGHAVRATLLATGLTELASVTGREDYRLAARRLWQNMATRRMYVTGGLGAIAHDEKFGGDHVLPNDGYLETCAAVGAAFFHQRLNLDAGDSRYADELERVLYNSALVGVSLDGDRYFYENPLEAGRDRVRWAWHPCPCCPPMFLKLMGAMPGYIYATSEHGLYVNLYAGSLVRARTGTSAVTLRQTTRYPWDGAVTLTIESDGPAEFDLNLRVPSWCQGAANAIDLYTLPNRVRDGAFVVSLNGEPVTPSIANGYARLRRSWKKGDIVHVAMKMPVQRVLAHPNVLANTGRVALMRGPIVYCLESIDNNDRLANILLPDEAELRTEVRPQELGGIVAIRAKALASVAGEASPRPFEITAIPYYVNANRAPAAWQVWLPRLAADETGQVAIRIDATQPGRPISRYLTGACIEDVNHQIYGGIYSQMIFGENFQEPPRSAPVRGFMATEGEWRVADGQVHGEAGAGPKLLSSAAPFIAGEAGVEVYLPGAAGGNGGLILRTAKAGAGADNFDGYEVAIDTARKLLVLGRHQHDFRLMKEVPCDVAPDRWIVLSAKLTDRTIEVFIDGKRVAQVTDDRPLPAGTVGLRHWQRPARYRNLWVKTAEQRVNLPFEPVPGPASTLSAMWGYFTTGDAGLQATIVRDRPFIGSQSQRIEFVRGTGEAGIENQGLNRWGMAFVKDKPYEGYLWLRTEKAAKLAVSLESRDGTRTYARHTLDVGGEEWRRYEFKLTPDQADSAGRFAIRLLAPGSVIIGHAFLQPGEWGRFKGLPVRRDVAEALVDQGITVLRYGGSMVNSPQYRWKKMIGPRDRRPPYRGTWYPYSTNGWGILDFLNLCEAAGFLAIPDFNIDETPQDMVDFIEYVNGPADSNWGRRRVADGHPAPYNLRHIQLGNEEKVDEVYYQKFARLAKAIWAKDPQIILVVGDFAYDRPIIDPLRIEGAASGITSLAGQKKILQLAKENGREVWFDVHIWTDGPNRSSSSQALKSFIDAIERLADGAEHRVVVFEFNANNHDHRRALANADMIVALMQDGRLPVVLSANCLQPDGQNDNGWDQGLLFLNPSRVWLQPPGYVTRMIARNHQPRVLSTRIEGAGASINVTATCGDDGKTLVLQVVNRDSRPWPIRLQVNGFTPSNPVAKVEMLAGLLHETNTGQDPTRLVPRDLNWRHGMKDGAATYVAPPCSFTVIRLE